MKTILAIIATCLLLMAQPAYSIDLKAAKAQGAVGETPSGYLAAVGTPSAEIAALIKNVNAQRKARYQEIAARNKTSLKAVEELAGKKAIEKSQAGSYIQQGGSWKKK
ncbi:MAG: YdbL family protein [Gammaproteobacteria bacterium]|nr:YdbL family protein [Gammaproteobacteria bacterium]